jgi:hypothetical protein
MKSIHFTFFLILYCNLNAQVEYGKYFSENKIRFSYTISGNAKKTHFDSLVFYQEPIWSGSKKNLIDTFQYGEFLLKVFHVQTGKLIYSRGFSDLFIEWQLTSFAKDSILHFNESVVFPLPLEKVRVELAKRDSLNCFQTVFTKLLDPSEAIIADESKVKRTQKKIHISGPVNQKLDIVFISEGYLEKQREKFFNDAKKFKDVLFSSSMFGKYKDKINIIAVFVPSEEEGVDIPADSISVRTCLDAHFGTFGIDRYLTLPDQDKIFDFLIGIPCEQVCVLVNSEKYGGGGIYNHYNIFTVGNVRSREVFLHEFGHGFVSLADEYFNSEVPYEDLAFISFEPYEPNVTALIDFDSKWSDLINDSIPLPTPDIPEYDNIVGVFEGAKYRSKGYYRPERNCIMHSLKAKEFCKVCQKAIQKMILFYAE